MWRYTLRDLTPDDDPEAWARTIAGEGSASSPAEVTQG